MMLPALDALRGTVWSLDELVEAANDLLPHYLPKESSGRTTDEVNPRLVRHYTTLGLIPQPRKEGREARYLYDHLVHLLLVRRMLAEGFSSAAIKRVLEGTAPDELERLLEAGVSLERRDGSGASDDPTSSFLLRLRASAGLDAAPAASASASASLSAATPAQAAAASLSRLHPTASPPIPFHHDDWTRVTLLDGLELHVRDDFRLPTHRLGDEQITQLVKVVLLQLEQRRKGRP